MTGTPTEVLVVVPAVQVRHFVVRVAPVPRPHLLVDRPERAVRGVVAPRAVEREPARWVLLALEALLERGDPPLLVVTLEHGEAVRDLQVQACIDG